MAKCICQATLEYQEEVGWKCPYCGTIYPSLELLENSTMDRIVSIPSENLSDCGDINALWEKFYDRVTREGYTKQQMWAFLFALFTGFGLGGRINILEDGLGIFIGTVLSYDKEMFDLRKMVADNRIFAKALAEWLCFHGVTDQSIKDGRYLYLLLGLAIGSHRVELDLSTNQ